MSLLPTGLSACWTGGAACGRTRTNGIGATARRTWTAKRFGFEITWKIGDESNATETCLFFDGKAHKIGAVDVEKFPGTDGGWMKPWHFTSEDGRFDVTMTPFFDNDTGVIVLGQLGMKDASGARTVERVRRARRRQKDRHQRHVRFLRICSERVVTPRV